MRQISVLLVDDDKSKLAMLCDSVSVYGNCTVTHCSTYEDAVDHLVNHYDIIVVDYYLHRGNFKNNGTGYDILQSYKSMHPKTHTILYSGNKDAIENRDAKKIAIDSMQVQTEIFNFLDNFKEDESVVEKNNETIKNELSMSKSKILNWIPLVVLSFGVVASFSVAQYKIDSTRADVISHCSDDKVYREKQTIKEIQTVATLTELMTMQREILKSIDEIKKEVRKNN